MSRERTFFMIKPDGVQRSHVGDVVRRVEDKGYRIVGMKMLMIPEEMAMEHYSEHSQKKFFGDLVSFITSGPVVAMVVEGDNVIEGIRKMMGKTDPANSAPGTIRGDYAVDLSRNIVHGSDSPASAEREISIFFDQGEIINWDKFHEEWVYP